MTEPDHDHLEVPEADEIEQLTPVVDTGDGSGGDAAPKLDELPDEAAEADVVEQAQQVDDEDEYPPA